MRRLRICGVWGTDYMCRSPVGARNIIGRNGKYRRH